MCEGQGAGEQQVCGPVLCKCLSPLPQNLSTKPPPCRLCLKSLTQNHHTPQKAPNSQIYLLNPSQSQRLLQPQQLKTTNHHTHTSFIQPPSSSGFCTVALIARICMCRGQLMIASSHTLPRHGSPAHHGVLRVLCGYSMVRAMLC